MKITFEKKRKAAEYAANLDYDSTFRELGKQEADLRKVTLELGVWRAFEWLEKEGILKEDK